jgi:hypothetical protein
MRARSQQGASLLIVLALVTFLGILIPAMLGLALTGSKVTVPVIEDRRELYAASSAIDAAVQQGRQDPDIGVPGGPCPTQIVTIDGFEVTIVCQQHAAPLDGCRYLDRFVTYTAEVREPGNVAVVGWVSAEAVYRFNPATGTPTVEVRQWNPDTSGPVSTTALPACSTTTVPTTLPPPPPPPPSTTVPPAVGVFAVWESPLATKDGNNWQAEGTISVTDQNGVPLPNVEVRILSEYLTPAGAWLVDATRSVFTTNTGTVTFYSSPRPRTPQNRRVPEMRLTVLAVTDPGGRTWTPPVPPLVLQLSAPSN